MKAEELQAMSLKFGEEVLYCPWCDQWKPRSKFYKYGQPHFLKRPICRSCYHNMDKILSNPESQLRLFKVLIKRMKVTVELPDDIIHQIQEVAQS